MTITRFFTCCMLGLGLGLALISFIDYAAGESMSNRHIVPLGQASITLTSNNTVALNGPVGSDSTSEVMQKVQDLNALDGQEDQPIYLFLYTPGGEITAGLDMLEVVKTSRRPVHTISMFAASMGFQIAQNLGQRYILTNGILMSHHARGGAQGEFGGRGTSQLQARIGVFERIVKNLDLKTVERTQGKQTLESYQEAYDHELWLLGSEAVTQGYADAVAQVSCDSSLNGTSMHTVNLDGPFAIRITYELSNCPLKVIPVAAKGSSSDKAVSKDTVNRYVTYWLNSFTNLRDKVIPMSY